MIFDILANRNEWWVPGKIVEARHRLKQYWKVLPGAALQGQCMGNIPIVGWVGVALIQGTVATGTGGVRTLSY